ncbi:hypothetical protein [Pseudomonas thivervalensis]|uniref:hypothetical protein n=1 Tax=Pseudomonas thivervalensis TaxID=86265 RepID=UPI00069D58A5|nr:hypothetical protein [Pseudomonas thivervalensis]OAB51853.1 hypothetical protein APS14_25865 [Pseudomonas thivervalensis]SDG74443.1 hypothetical protein SAMN04490204_5509 [Pseudomonas thivervalensis]
MKRFEDYTDFEGENWNGWMNGRGLPTGELKTGENGNMYWSGLLKGAPGTFYKIQPSLLKRFSFQSAEERRALYEVYFLYRIHEREPDEAKDIAIAVCSEGGLWEATPM